MAIVEKTAYIRGKTDTAAIDLRTSLGHTPVFERTDIRPRFLKQSVRAQGGLIATDANNRELLLSVITPDNLHMDDKFARVSYNNAGWVMRYTLESRGEMLGIAILDERIHVFRPSEVEVIDVQSGHTRVTPIDCASGRSIIVTPFGLVWAGYNGIYIIEPGGGGFRVLNERWLNLYRNEVQYDAFPVMTDELKESILTGYSDYDHTLWVTIGNMQFRYNFIHDKWLPRRIENRSISHYAIDERGKLLAGFEDDILLYPHRGDNEHRDGVSFNGESYESGIETSFDINLGGLYDLTENYTLYSLLVDHEGRSVNGNGMVKLDIYINNSTVPLDTKWFPVDSRAIKRRLPRFGRIETMRLVFTFEEEEIDNINDFLISKISLGIVPIVRYGTR